MLKKLYHNVLCIIKQGGVIWKILVFLNGLRKNNRWKGKILKRNRDLKGSHEGERCFILGNGPSLRSIDFDKLKDEQVFTVNLLMQCKDFNKLNTNYHFLMAPGSFGISDEIKTDDSEYQNVRMGLHDCDQVELFVPIDAYNIVTKRKYNDNVNVRYIGTMPAYGQINDIDISQYTVGFRNGVQFAIQTAIYMGFKQIYLLGCDATLLKYDLDAVLNNDIEGMHVYEEPDATKKSLVDIYNNTGGIVYELQANIEFFRAYEKLNDYCDRNNIELVNLSKPTLIDSIRRANFEDVI